jgi:hypothetical protein
MLTKQLSLKSKVRDTIMLVILFYKSIKTRHIQKVRERKQGLLINDKVHLYKISQTYNKILKRLLVELNLQVLSSSNVTNSLNLNQDIKFSSVSQYLSLLWPSRICQRNILRRIPRIYHRKKLTLIK